LDVYGLEVESIATIRSLAVNNIVKNEETNLIVDIGSRRTSFIIAEGVVPYFTSSIPFSSEGINDSIMKSLNIGNKEAEEVKINNGIENMDESNPIFKAVNPLMENLVVEITKTMDFYGEMSGRSQKVSRIILCGGGSNMKGIPEYLNQRIKIEVVVGNPWINLNLEGDLSTINKATSVRYATAAGLAIRALNYGD
jgi:type IV pilus assembly protein PilM